MPVPGLTTLVLAATRLAYRMAEKKRWLPGGAYHRLSVDSLKTGDLDEAERLNRLALERKPRHGKALVVRDLIAMRRDASTAELRRQLDEEQLRIRDLQAERLACLGTVTKSERRQRRRRLSFWLLVPVAAAGALITGSVAANDGFPLWGRIVAGVAGAVLVVALVVPRFIGGGVEASIREEESRAAMMTLAREIESRRKRSAELERQLLEIAGTPEYGPSG